MSNPIDYTNLNARIVEQAYKAAEPAEPAERCLECGGKAQYIRHTQFAGNHPYCLEHAMKEEDYKQSDSYTYWSECPVGIEVSVVNGTTEVVFVSAENGESCSPRDHKG
jgi:hypothetical protein